MLWQYLKVWILGVIFNGVHFLIMHPFSVHHPIFLTEQSIARQALELLGSSGQSNFLDDVRNQVAKHQNICCKRTIVKCKNL